VASIYRRTRKKPIPAGAELVERRGKRFAVWQSRGRKRRAEVTPDGTAVLIPDPNYTVAWFDWQGKRRKTSGGPDKDAAAALGQKLESEELQRRRGLIDPRQERLAQEGRRTLEEHLTNFEAKMRAAGRDVRHVADTVRYVRAIASSADFAKIGDITADGVNTYAGQLRDRGRSARTVQAYLTAFKGFTKWLTAHHKLPADPLASVQRPNPTADRRMERRMLLPEEWDWLRSVTLAKNAERHDMPAAERVLLYATAIQTGLRASELRSLTRGRLFLDSDLPFVTCKPGCTKNKKEARQYVQPELADELRAHVATKAPRAAVFNMPAKRHSVPMLLSDLADARREWQKAVRHDSAEAGRRRESDFLKPVNHDGEVLDFHALRHTCGAWLAMGGAYPKAVQAVMRHSTITLTMDTYGHLFPGQEADTVARFPQMLGDAPEAQQATGTADAAASLGEHLGAQSNGQTWLRVARSGEKVGAAGMVESAGDPEAQTLTLARNEKSRQPMATAGERRRARESNPQPLAGHLISSQAASQFAYPPAAPSQFSPLEAFWQEGPGHSPDPGSTM